MYNYMKCVLFYVLYMVFNDIKLTIPQLFHITINVKQCSV